jgi:CHAT domain-containing protein
MEPLARLGEVAAARGRTDEAQARYAQAFAISEDLLGSLRFVSGDARLATLLQGLDATQDQIWSLVADHPADPALAELGAAVAFLRKGRSLDERAAVGRSLRGGGDPRIAAQLDELRRLQDRYAAVAFSRDAASAAQAAALQRTIADAERELSRRSAAFRAEQLPDATRIAGDIAARLGADQVLVEIVAYRAYRFAPSVGTSPWSGSRYLAFVVAPGGRVTAYPLGDANTVDGAARALLERIADREAPADDPALLSAARAAFDRILAPLARELAGKTRVVLSLDGALQMVPFAAMRDDHGWLLEQYAFEYVSSGRDLLPQPTAAASGIEVLAAPDFSRVGEGAARFGLRNVTPLPATAGEAEVIARMTGASPRTGAAATEDALLAVTRPRVLHIATHGVFLDDAATGDGAGLRGVSLVEIGEQPAASPENPLLRSALILAPASGAAATARDGIVTALEVASMDLRGTQLVVLSACETGLGELRKGQGVYGLRRAFLIAGAETLVTSLWRVSDAATLELMTGFYGQLAAGVPRVEAMGRAAKAVRVQRPHPFYWAPFVVVGRDGPVGLPKPGG